MPWISALHEIENSPKTTGWPTSLALLKRYEQCFSDLRKMYSVFELALNIKFEDGVFFNAFEECGAFCPNCQSGFLETIKNGGCRLPFTTVVYVFRAFFESSTGGGYYKPAADKYRESVKSRADWITGNFANLDENDFLGALKAVWPIVFPGDDANILGHDTRTLFCSRCWLIKNFQKGEGHSELCQTIKDIRRLGDKKLREHIGNYPQSVDYFRRLLEHPGCCLERDFLWDFLDNGIEDNVRFHWFSLLDARGQALIRDVIAVGRANNGQLRFQIDAEPSFPDVVDEADRVLVEVLLKNRTVVRLSYSRQKNGSWRFNGDHRSLSIPVGEVTGIRRFEIASSKGRRIRGLDVLGPHLADCCQDSGFGMFLLNEGGNGGIYSPFARRRLPEGSYRAFVFRHSRDANGFLSLEYTGDPISVNGLPCADRIIVVSGDMSSLLVTVGDAVHFEFGISTSSPLRDGDVREKNIRGTDPRRIYLSSMKWRTLWAVDSWRYKCGDRAWTEWDVSMLYQEGILSICYMGRNYPPEPVTFVDFSSEQVMSQFPVRLGLGVGAKFLLTGCGSLSGTNVIVSERESTYSLPLKNGVGILNVPIDREGIAFRTENGEEALSIPFRPEGEVVEKDLALEDLRRLRCVVTCADNYVRAEITEIVYQNGRRDTDVGIPLLKDRHGFSFWENRRYLMSHSQQDGDLKITDILDERGLVRQLTITEIPEEGPSNIPHLCRLNIYDPKLQRPKIATDKQIEITLDVDYSSRPREKVMRWLATDALDSEDGVKVFDSWTSDVHTYSQSENGRWSLTLRATALHQDLDSVFHQGAAILAFITEPGNSSNLRRPLSGGFCILGLINNPNVPIDDGWRTRLALAMHERYGSNTKRLGDLLSILSLNYFDRVYRQDYRSFDVNKMALDACIDRIRNNINQFGIGADLYMNAFYNERPEQWSGYLFFAGWYYACRVAEEMKNGNSRGYLPSRVENCSCFLSSTGIRVWHPLLISSKSLKRANGHEAWWCKTHFRTWRTYLEDMEVQSIETLIDTFLQHVCGVSWYISDLAQLMRKSGYDGNDLVAFCTSIVDRLFAWREAQTFLSAATEEDRQVAAEDLFREAQFLRDVLIGIDKLDERLWNVLVGENLLADRNTRAPDKNGVALLGDIIKAFDSKTWTTSAGNRFWYEGNIR